MTNLQQLKESARKEFDLNFEDNGVIQTYVRRNGGSRTNTTNEELKDFMDTLLEKAYEQGKRDALDEIKETQEKLLQGFAYKKSFDKQMGDPISELDNLTI